MPPAKATFPTQEWLFKSDGKVMMTGNQALVRLPLIQHQLDQKKGLNTAGFISGYRGSPLGGFDSLLYKLPQPLEQSGIEFAAN